MGSNRTVISPASHVLKTVLDRNAPSCNPPKYSRSLSLFSKPVRICTSRYMSKISPKSDATPLESALTDVSQDDVFQLLYNQHLRNRPSAKPIRICTYTKPGDGYPLWLTTSITKGLYPIPELSMVNCKLPSPSAPAKSHVSRLITMPLATHHFAQPMLLPHHLPSILKS